MTWAGRAARTLATAVADRAPAVAVAAADSDGTEIVTAGCSPGDGFEIGSITKTMTGTLLADAVIRGQVSLEDPIGRWLDAGENADITLGRLATHTSGLPRLSPSHVTGAADPYAFLTADVAQQELRISPRRQRPDHEYSNFGFQVLGLALERAAQARFDSLLGQRIGRPLAIACAVNAASLQGHRAGRPVGPWTHHLPGAGGVVITAQDMAAYLQACLTAPQGPLGPAISLAQRPHHRIDELRSAGLGWALGPPGYLGHTGGTSGFRSMLGINTANRRAAVVLANEAGAAGLAAAVKAVLDNDTRH
jgi:CubicO group peptidase (beta-lactamase class C family)